MNIDLYREMRKELKQLEDQAITKGKLLINTRGPKNIFVGDAYKNIRLDPEVIAILCTVMSFTQKYSISPPSTILELIEACRGLSNTIKQLQYFQRTNLVFYHTDIVSYVDTIEQELACAKGRTYEKRSYSPHSPLPFCALCWKHTYSSKFYCRDHNPSLNLANHKKAKNKLFTAIKTTSSDEDILEKFRRYEKGYFKGHRLAPNLYTWTASVVPRAKILIISNDVDADANIGLIIETIKNSYPQTTRRLAHFFKSKPTLDLEPWVIKIIGILDRTYIIWKDTDDERWIKESSQQKLIQVLLNFLHRYEAFLVIQNATSKYGPEKGSNENLELREDIQRLLAKQRQEIGRTNQSEIARELNLSRQRISVLIKELGSNKLFD